MAGEKKKQRQENQSLRNEKKKQKKKQQKKQQKIKEKLKGKETKHGGDDEEVASSKDADLSLDKKKSVQLISDQYDIQVKEQQQIKIESEQGL